jgi:hypothetical protein
MRKSNVMPGPTDYLKKEVLDDRATLEREIELEKNRPMSKSRKYDQDLDYQLRLPRSARGPTKN